MIWQIQAGYERGAAQRNFLKLVSQTIPRDLEKHHPKVLERFYVNAKDRKYHPDDKRDWKCNPLSIDLWTKEVFIQKMEYVHNHLAYRQAGPVTAGLCLQPNGRHLIVLLFLIKIISAGFLIDHAGR